MLKCEVCGVPTGFNEDWTEEMARKEAKELRKQAKELFEDYDENEPEITLCTDCLDMTLHKIKPSITFLKGMLRLEYITEEDYERYSS